MAGQLKIGGNVIATHAGTEGAGTVTLDSSTLTIGSNVNLTSATFPAGHILQSVFSPTRTANGDPHTNLGGNGAVVCALDGQITISSGNGVLIYMQGTVYVDRASADMGYIAYIREGLDGSGATLSNTYERDSITDGNWWNTTTIWAYDSSPASTTPDYCLTLTRASSGGNNVRLNTTDADSFKTFLFEVKR